MKVTPEMTLDLAIFLEKHQIKQAILILPWEDNSFEIMLSQVSTEQLRQLSHLIANVVPDKRGPLN